MSNILLLVRGGVAGHVAINHPYMKERISDDTAIPRMRYPFTNALVERTHDRIRVLVLSGTDPADRF